MNAADMKRHYVIRFINTRLAGCEYIMREEKSSFIVANRDALALVQQQSCDPAATYILDDNINTRFDIVWRSESPQPILVSHHNSAITEQIIHFHQTTDIDGVCFTLRPESEENVPVSEIAEEHHEATSIPPATAAAVVRRRGVHMSLVIMLIVLCAGVGYAMLARQDTQQIRSVAQLLGGEPQQFTTFIGRNSGVYVFARDASSGVWARQSLIRNNMGQQITVLSASDEEEKIARTLSSRWPQLKFHTVHFDDPARPEIILSLERTKSMTPQDLEQVGAKMVALFPWANRFVFSTISDRRIADSAEQGLKGIVERYDKRNEPDSVTFSLTGTLNDSELNALKKYVGEFRTKWRGDYIQFDIALKDNPLQGKSRLYGDKGYIKISPEQWYFPEKR